MAEALRRSGLLAVILALTAMLCAPSGYMPGLGRDGAPALVLCSGHGPAADLGDHGSAPGKPARPDNHGACPFAAHGPAPAAPSVLDVAVIPSAPATIGAQAQPADLAPGRGLAAPPPPSQAPPLSV